MKSKKIFIAGGGTGGHIYPAVAIARAIQNLNPNIEIHFVGTETGLEKKIVPKEGFPLHLIQGGKLNFSGGIINKISTLVRLPIGLIQSFILIFKFRPDFVLGVGGYASGPFVLAAALSGGSTAIWEANALPGMANRWLSFFVDKCFVVFEEAKRFLNNRQILTTGMPLRAEIENAKLSARQDSKFHLLSFGGSQGARAITTALSDAVLQGGEWTKNLAVVHQIGSLDFEKVQKKYQGSQDIVTAFEFIYDMPKYYSWADLIVCRGGAGTLSEIAAYGVPAIVIPLPLADNHQQKNAEELVSANASVMLPQKNLTPESLITEIQKLRNDSRLRETMGQNLKKFYKPKAAHIIAENILNSVG